MDRAPDRGMGVARFENGVPNQPSYKSCLHGLAGFQSQGVGDPPKDSRSRHRQERMKRIALAMAALLVIFVVSAFVIHRILFEMWRRKEAEKRLRTLNAELERKVAERSARLEESNRTLRSETANRKRREALVHRLSMAVEQSPASIVITDLSGRIIYVNRKFVERTGYSVEESLGRNPRILKSGHTRVEEYQEMWQAIAAGKEWRGEFCNRKKNGELYWESAVICPIRDEDSKISHFVAIKEDVTERRRTEKDLQLTRFSLEHASDSVFWADPEGRFLYVNEAALAALGYSREELAELSVSDIDPTFPREKWQGFWEQLKVQRSMTLETKQRAKDGRVFPIEVRANYVEFDGQEYLFAFTRDISERQLIQAQLQQAQKMESIGQLAAGVAHEINTPTQFVVDNLTFLRDSWKSTNELVNFYRSAIHENFTALPQGLAERVAQVEHGCDLEFIAAEVPQAIEQSLDGASRVAEIVRAMKVFSHPNASEKTAIDINKAIESTIIVARNEWKYVADVITELDHSLPQVSCFPSDINQVILNLLVNAAHAINEKGYGEVKGRIQVRTHRRDDSVEISVMDTGTGIPEGIRGKVFDPFFTTKEIGKGTGQGLSIAYALVVKKHSGKIWFETEAGMGTTFFIEIPIG